MWKIISFVLLVVCLIAIAFVAITIFKLLAALLMLWFVAWFCWQLIKDLFSEKDKPP